MSLVADYSDSSSSSTEENEESVQHEDQAIKKASLPSASYLLSKKGGEVLQNRYQKEEQIKKASLEQHVKMVEYDENLKTKNGKQVCWNNRKGRCRFGSKCQFAHDSDLATESQTESPKTSQEVNIRNPQEINKSTSLLSNDKKRKRPGLGDSLIPGKRVMKAYLEVQKKS